MRILNFKGRKIDTINKFNFNNYILINRTAFSTN